MAETGTTKEEAPNHTHSHSDPQLSFAKHSKPDQHLVIMGDFRPFGSNSGKASPLAPGQFETLKRWVVNQAKRHLDRHLKKVVKTME